MGSEDHDSATNRSKIRVALALPFYAVGFVLFLIGYHWILFGEWVRGAEPIPRGLIEPPELGSDE